MTGRERLRALHGADSQRFRVLYGAGPLHVIALLASFAIAAAAVVGWFQRPGDVVGVLIWFAAAIVIHDLVLMPLYSLLDRIALDPLRRLERRRSTAVAHLVSPTPYLRIPALLSGLLLIVFLPVIFGLGQQAELAASGIVERGYLARWLLATGIMFALSGAVYAVKAASAGRRRHPAAGHDGRARADEPSLEGLAPESQPPATDQG